MIHRFFPLICGALALVAHPIESRAGSDSAVSDKDLKLSIVTNIIVREFRFDGNTVYSDEVLSKATAPYVNRPITLDDLEEARRAITLQYVTNGYVNSGAILPDQSVRDGIVTYRIK